ncbi:hypothetical protein Tco_1505063 [Tanacetum coccineum]
MSSSGSLQSLRSILPLGSTSTISNSTRLLLYFARELFWEFLRSMVFDIGNEHRDGSSLFLLNQGIVQAAKLLKQTDIQDGREGCVMSTQEYIKKVIDDVGEIKNFLKNGKLDQVVAIVKSCTPNVIGDLTMTLKDLLGTIPGTIHQKVIDKGGNGKDIIIGVALILANVLVFSPKPSMHYLNITMRNVVKVLRKDTIPVSGSSVGGSGMLMEEEEIVKLMEEEEMVDLELQVCRNVTDQDEEASNLALEEEARQVHAE